MAAVDYEKLAPFYDSLVTSDDDVAFFVELARTAPGRVLELMAGTGRLSIPIALAGVALTCVDNSPGMLVELRRKASRQGLTVGVVQQDVTRLALESRFALAFIAFHSFEEIIEDADRETLLRRVYRHLQPGGRFVCTLHDPAVRLREVGPGRDRRWRFQNAGDGRQLELSLTTVYDESRSLVIGKEQLRDLDNGNLIADLPLCFRLSSRTEFQALAQAAGYEIEALYGDFKRGRYQSGQSTSMVWVLERAA